MQGIFLTNKKHYANKEKTAGYLSILHTHCWSLLTINM